jgi:hypothetical protein
MPHEPHRRDEDEVLPRWRPAWRDVVRAVGWRAWLIVPAIALVVGMAVGLLLIPYPELLMLGIKILVVEVGILIALIAYLFRRAIALRSEPFCIYCGYTLTGLPDRHTCPECGRPYTWEEIARYRDDPDWLRERRRARRKLPPRDPRRDVPPRPPGPHAADGT